MKVWVIYGMSFGDEAEHEAYCVGHHILDGTLTRAEWQHGVQFAMTLNKARELIPAEHNLRLERVPDDGASVVELWI